jgi:flagellar protein FlaJ
VSNYIDRLYRLSGYTLNADVLRFVIAYIPLIEVPLVVLAVFMKFVVIRNVLLIIVLVLIIDYVAVLLYALVRVKTRAGHFDRGIITTLLTAIPLLASNATLMDVINTLALVERDPEIAREFRIILRDVREGGLDVISAIRRSIERVPSQVYADIMGLLVESYRVSSNVADVLFLKLDYLIRNRFNRLRSTTQTLSFLLEIYLVMVLLLPILLVLMAITLSPLGPIYLGPLQLDPTLVLIITLLIYAPIMGYVSYILIDSTMSSI